MKNQYSNLFLFAAIALLISATAFAQPVHLDWGKNYTSVSLSQFSFTPGKTVADNNGQLLVGGELDTVGVYHSTGLFKLDTAGNIVWHVAHRYYASYPGKGEKFHDLVTDASNNIYVAYEVEDSLTFGTTRWCVMKVSSAGVVLWDKMYTGQYGAAAYPTSLKVDNAGHVYITGLGSNTALADAAMLTIKLDTDGSLLWDKMIDGNSTNFGNYTSAGMDLALDNNNNIYVVGCIANYDSIDHLDLVLAKYSSSGNLDWNRIVDDTIGFRSQWGKKVLLDAANNVIVGGTTSSVYQNYYNDIMVLKYNDAGTLLWKKVHSDNMDETFNDMVLDNQGNVQIAGGYKFFGAFAYYPELLKLNAATGDTAWVYQNTNTDWIPKSLATDGAGNLFAWGVRADNMPAPTPQLFALNAAGQVTNTISFTDTSVFDMHTQNIIYNNQHLYASVYGGNNSTTNYNGQLCKFSFEINTGVESKATMHASVFPNPFSETIIIQSEMPAGETSLIEVVDVAGRKIYQTALQTSTHTIQTSAWLPGLYFAEIKTGSKQARVKLLKAE